ncbi:MAG: hypothetical protein GF401_09050 [Chitinivibrionales bacterium]|nr:hypothetical protein [Chitinivibrionales bacterium]
MNIYDEPQTVATEESFSELLKDLRDESIVLVRQQIELAKAETGEKVSRLLRNGAYLMAGSLIAYAGFLFLLNGLNYLGAWGLQNAGLTQSIAIMVMSLIVGAVVGIIGYAFIQKAIKTIKHTSAVPEKTIKSMKEDREWLNKKRKH